MDSYEIEIDRSAAARYVRLRVLIGGFFVIGWLLLRVGLAEEIKRWADSYKCRLGQDRLTISSVFKWRCWTFCKTEYSIPIEWITDVQRVQGPLLAYMGIEMLRIQTAGSGFAKGTIIAPMDAEGARDRIFQAIRTVRDKDSTS
jgi:membrane protein YdbS with pleckstrin-like domain